MEDCSPKNCVGLMWRGTGEHNRLGTQEVNVKSINRSCALKMAGLVNVKVSYKLTFANLLRF